MNSNPTKLKAFVFYSSLIISILLSATHQTTLLGKLSLSLLTLVIFTKPLALLLPNFGLFKVLLAVRRETGQASAFFAFGHIVSQIFPGASLFGLLTFGASSGPGSFQFWGFWALILMILLFVTSNDLSLRLLKRNWFYLHKLIHPLYIFAMLHYGLQKGPLGLVLSFAVLILLYGARILAARGLKFSVPTLNKPNQ